MKRDWAFWGAIAYLCAAMFISPWFIFGPIAACVALSPVIWLWGWWKGDRNLKESGCRRDGASAGLGCDRGNWHRHRGSLRGPPAGGPVPGRDGRYDIALSDGATSSSWCLSPRFAGRVIYSHCAAAISALRPLTRPAAVSRRS